MYTFSRVSFDTKLFKIDQADEASHRSKLTEFNSSYTFQYLLQPLMYIVFWKIVRWKEVVHTLNSNLEIKSPLQPVFEN